MVHGVLVLVGGIGGKIKDIDKHTLFTFSGPVSAEDCFDTEITALMLILSIRANHTFINARLTVCTDSKQMVEEFEKLVVVGKEDTRTAQAILKNKYTTDGLRLVYINREHNSWA